MAAMIFSENAITDVSPILKYVIKYHNKIFDSKDVTAAPVALFYDMDLWDNNFEHCKTAFGNFQHFMAIKGNSISKMIIHAYKDHNIGVECASIGEVLHVLNHCKIPKNMIVFDSPCKTIPEIHFAIKEQIHCNLDNFQEYNRVVKYIKENPNMKTGGIGLRINPLVGAGHIKALSVSTNDSKFGIPITEYNKLKQCYQDHKWLNCVHVHVGSGGMGAQILCAGIRIALDFANDINNQNYHGTDEHENQIKIIDIGGGLPANYWSNSFKNIDKNIPNFTEYSELLKIQCPELFQGKYKIYSEFGQSLSSAKCGFLASRIEYMKFRSLNQDEVNELKQQQSSSNMNNMNNNGGSEDNNNDDEQEDKIEYKHQLAIIHFGADCCPRQVYASTSHARRIEAYQANGSNFQPTSTEEVEDDDHETKNKKMKLDIDNDNNDDEKKEDKKNKKNTKVIYQTSVGGPLCFQGDFILKNDITSNILKSNQLSEKDFIVMKDAGSNTLSLFSRHCSRLKPPVYGYRWKKKNTLNETSSSSSLSNKNGSNDMETTNNEISDFFELSPRETMESLSNFWGPIV